MRAVGCRRSAQLQIFPYPTRIPSRIQDHRIIGPTIQVDFGLQVAKTPTYPVICPLPVVVVLCDHNLPTLQAD